MRSGNTVLFPIILAVSLCLSTAAQDLPDVAQGLQPYVAYHGGELDQVNTYNGSLTIRIPLVSYPQKGSLSLSYSVIFNSFGFEDVAFCDAASGMGPLNEIPVHNGCTNNIRPIPTGIQSSGQSVLPLGPRLIADQTLVSGGVSAFRYDLNPTQPPVYGLFYVISSDNAQHPLGLANDGSYRSLDQSGFAFSLTGTPAYPGNLGSLEGDTYSGDTTIVMAPAPGKITDSKGITYTSSAITDPDGNAISIPNSPPGFAGFFAGLPATDSTGRAIPAPSAASGTSGCPTLSQAASQPLSSAENWTPPGTGSGYLFCFATVSLNSTPQFKQSGVTQYTRTASMLQAIVLPNGTYWGFVYDSSTGSGGTGSGHLTTLIYPTGGTVNYTYIPSEGVCDNLRISGMVSGAIFTFPPAVLTRTMTDAQGWSGTWTYAYPPAASGAMTGSILSPAGDLTVTNWATDGTGSGCGFISGGQNVYQGNPAEPATATPLQSTTTTYLYTTLGAPPYVAGARDLQTTTVLNGSASSSILKGYADGSTLTLLNCNWEGQDCVSGASSGSEPIGNPTSIKYTDYSGSVLKQEQTTYEWQNPGTAGAYFAGNFLDIPYIASTLDANGNTVASTIYTYDESTYSPGGTRGHPTTVTKALNISASSGPTTHTGWNANGEKAYFVDANINTNNYGHTIDYQYNGSSASCNGSQVTDTYDAVNDHVSGGYDCSSGRLVSYTDANGANTQVSYDGLGRLTLVTYPAVTSYGGSGSLNPTTSFCYETCAPNQVQRTIVGTPDPTETTTVIFDGFGREIHRYTAAPSGQISIDTTYDADGRIHSVSNPYYSTSDSTYGLTTYAYDTLNRKTQQTQQDGTSTLQWSYSGNVLTATDELGRVHQQTSDALGRLTAVKETDPTTGTLDLQTIYSYDPQDDLTTVNQQGNSAAGDTARNRSFSYDSLSRLVTSYNPESGWTCYGTTGGAAPNGSNCTSGYDANGNLLSKTVQYSTAPPPVTINYTYDALNRLVAKSYQNDSNRTPLSCFQYGLSSTAQAGANQVDRLMNAWTQSAAQGSCASNLPSSGFLTLNGFVYDPMGRVTSEQQCTPTKCTASSGPSLSYTYDLAGNRTGVSNSAGAQGQPLFLTYGFDAAARDSSLTSSWTAFATNLFMIGQSSGYNASGQLQNWTQGPTLTIMQGYTNRLWMNSITATGQTR